MFAIHPCESVKAVVQKWKHQTTNHTHANLATGTQSTTRPTIRRVNAQMKSAFESTRWARARLSVRTPAVTGTARTIFHFTIPGSGFRFTGLFAFLLVGDSVTRLIPAQQFIGIQHSCGSQVMTEAALWQEQ